MVTTAPAAAALRVYGGPEALLTLADEGLLAGRPVLLNADPAGVPAAASVVTDSLRRRVRNFGELRPVLLAHADRGPARRDVRGDRRLHRARLGPVPERGAVPRRDQRRHRVLVGRGHRGHPQPVGQRPAAVRRGRRGPADRVGVGQLERPGRASGSGCGSSTRPSPGTISVAFADRPEIGPAVTRVTITTAAGQVTDRVRATGGRAQPLRVPPGRTGWLQLTVTGVAGRGRVRHPGGHQGAHRARADGRPGDRRARPARRDAGPPPWCWPRPSRGRPAACAPRLRWVCSPALTVPTEEQYGFDHAFTVPDAGQATLRGQAVLTTPLRGGTYPGTGRSGHRRPAVWARASSTYTADPRDQALAAARRQPGDHLDRQHHRRAAGAHHRLAAPDHRAPDHRAPDTRRPGSAAGADRRCRRPGPRRQRRAVRGRAVRADADPPADDQVHPAAGPAPDHRCDHPRRAGRAAAGPAAAAGLRPGTGDQRQRARRAHPGDRDLPGRAGRAAGAVHRLRHSSRCCPGRTRSPSRPRTSTACRTWCWPGRAPGCWTRRARRPPPG